MSITKRDNLFSSHLLPFISLLIVKILTSVVKSSIVLIITRKCMRERGMVQEKRKQKQKQKFKLIFVRGKIPQAAHAAATVET